MEPWTLVYDSECGFCRWSVARILAWERHGRLVAVAVQDPSADRLVGAMPHDRRMGSFHLVTPTGRVSSGGEAVPKLLRLLPGGSLLAGLSEAFPVATDGLYRWVARHRGSLGRWVGAVRH